ncbi:MAG: hypothetical protein NUV55_00975 [Sulfuricaulis sp.]|uniref:hypothetical protein n=1 Tax=Sulfuricaulis sp. TaxID=2003553 RepID=UPI0025DD6DB6|nr:hypothetical protein [Sulfuricaulis sp.]MCR4345769.1 hypothetical protein [Sulfuricaulis sp.]
MNRRGHETGSRKITWVAGIWLVLALAACEPFWSTPEGRAREFIEALVVSPAEIQPLRDIANLPPEENPEALIGDLSARISLDFLRARQAQGVSLKFVQGETRRTDDTHRAAMIHVTYLQPGTPVTGEVRFLVRIEKVAQARWRIARVTGDN